MDLSTSQPWTEGPRGPGATAAGRRSTEWVGWAGVGGVLRALGLEMRREPGTLPSRSPGADVRSPGARILQTFPGRGSSGGGEGAVAVPARGSAAGGGDPPVPRRPRRAELAVRGRRPRPPRLPGVSRRSLQPAPRAPARAPEGRYLGAPAPRSLPAAVGASLQLPHPTSASAEGEGRGRGERRNRPFLRRRPPAGIASSRAGARRSAAQRPGGAGAGDRGAAAAPSPFLSPSKTPGGANPPSRTPGLGGRWGYGLTLFGAGPGWGE